MTAVTHSRLAPSRLESTLVTLAAMLGHSKINMVLRYAHPTQEHQSRAMEKMKRFVAQQRIEAAAQGQRISEAIQ
jgi:hypothetical protein